MRIRAKLKHISRRSAIIETNQDSLSNGEWSGKQCLRHVKLVSCVRMLARRYYPFLACFHFGVLAGRNCSISITFNVVSDTSHTPQCRLGYCKRRVIKSKVQALTFFSGSICLPTQTHSVSRWKAIFVDFFYSHRVWQPRFISWRHEIKV